LYHPQLSAEVIRSQLLGADINIPQERIAFEKRGSRWLVQWGGAELAWFAANEEGAAQLAFERDILALVHDRCQFPTPRVLHVAPDEAFDIRTRLAGIVDPARLHERLRNDANAASHMGRWIGTALAELHAVIKQDSPPAWLPRKASWPETAGWIRERLPVVIGNNPLVAEINSLLDIYEDLQVADDDLVLAHTDLGLHNIVFAGDSLQPCGLIDFESAAYVDRHYDFRYLIFDFADATLLTAACHTYETITGRRLLPARIQLYNAVSACCYLAYRVGIAPETRWCGRTLVEDLVWTSIAVERVRSNR
jgi:aminoglycoside phosphotransferase (APT) family kinase protein